MYTQTYTHTVLLTTPLRQGGLLWVGERCQGGPCMRAVNTLQCGLWVLSLGVSQRNTSLVVSIATSQFPWNGKACGGLEPEWAFWLHVCAMRVFREEKVLGTLT